MAATATADDEILQVWATFKTIDKDSPDYESLRNRLVERYMPLVRYNGERIWQRLPDGVELDDLISAGIFGLMDAITAVYESYPGMRAFASRGSIITSNDGGTRSINLDISGPSLAVIYDVALATYRRAQEVFGNPRIQSSPSSLTLAQPLVDGHEGRRSVEIILAIYQAAF